MRLSALCLGVLWIGLAAGLAGPVQPWDAPPQDRDWLEFLPRGTGILPVDVTGWKPVPPGGLDTGRERDVLDGLLDGPAGQWPGFEYGLTAPKPRGGADASPAHLDPLTESAFYGPVSPTAVGEGSWDPLAVLAVADPAAWAETTLSGSSRSREQRRYGADAARAGAPVSEDAGSDIFAVIPEPATLGLLGLGALALLRRRRR